MSNKITPGKIIAEELNWYGGAVHFIDWSVKKQTGEDKFAKRARFLHAEDIIHILKHYGFTIVRG